MNRKTQIENINKHVDAYVNSTGFKKESIAERIGIGRTTFYTKLRGESDFSAFEAYDMAALFGCTVDELLDTTPTTS